MDQITPRIPTPNLQTPPQADHDDQAFLGENWFFYWKLGSSLWRAKIEEYTRPGPLLVPINWSFHTETGESYDFADRRPETNLKKLVDQARQAGRTLAFFLPLTPVPFLPNGGVPHLLARNLAQDPRGIAYGILDGENHINKLYSFFDKRVFQSYARFTRELGLYFVQSGIDALVWGMECGHIGAKGFESFLSDSSPCWKKSFDDFIGARQDSRPLEQLRHDFCQLIREMYQNQAAKDIQSNWEGVVKVGFLDGHPGHILDQLEETNASPPHSEQTLEMLTVADLPSTVLVSPKLKRNGWSKMLDDIVIGETIRKFQQSTTPPDWQSILTPLRFFEIHHSRGGAHWDDLYLKHYLQKFYRWTYLENWEAPPHKSESETDAERIHFFQGHDLTVEKFHNILHLLMNEQHLILDQSGMPEECVRKMESFFLENDLTVEKINFHTDVQHIQLKSSRLIIFDGFRLAQLSPEKMQNFWHRLIGVFELRHVQIPHYPAVEHYWRTRLPAPEELNYEEIRRLGLYNTSSVKRKIDIPLPGNFKLLRLIDQIHVNVRNGSRHITLELGPEGSLSLDFGVLP